MTRARRLLLAFVALAAGSLAGCRQLGNWSGRSEKVGAAEAREWARGMGIEASGVSCSGYDTDDDGYVSCSVGYRLADGSLRTVPLECARAFTLNDGCREVKLNPLR